jgi:hypothetical protein
MRRLIFLFAFVLLSSALYSQSGGIAFTGASTTGEFSQYVNGAGGLTIDFSSFADPAKTTMVYGLDAGFFIYGYKSDRVELLMSDGTVIDATRERTNSIITLHGFLRVIGPEKFIRPYAEMVFGGSLFSTSSSVKDYYTNDEITSRWDKATMAWNVGVGGGLMSKVYTPPEPAFFSSVYLDLRIRYLAGSRTSYLTEKDIVIDPATARAIFTPSRSKTDMFTFSLGVQVPFTFGQQAGQPEGQNDN